jgi:hypothetical protein
MCNVIVRLHNAYVLAIQLITRDFRYQALPFLLRVTLRMWDGPGNDAVEPEGGKNHVFSFFSLQCNSSPHQHLELLFISFGSVSVTFLS